MAINTDPQPPKCREKQTIECSALNGHLYHISSSQASGIISEVEQKDCVCERKLVEDYDETTFTWHSLGVTTTNTQHCDSIVKHCEIIVEYSDTRVEHCDTRVEHVDNRV